MIAEEANSEICCEMGHFYEENEDWEEAAVWYYNAVYEAMEGAEVVEMEKLLEVTRQEGCQYLVMGQGKETDTDPEKSGLVLIDEIDGYRIYQDPEVAAPDAGR